MKDAPCKYCNDRVIEPNCHNTCEKYINWCKEREVEVENRRKHKGEYTAYQCSYRKIYKSNLVNWH